MSSASDTAILSAGMITVTSTVAASVLPASMGGKGELPAARLVFGSGLAFTGLSMLGEFEPVIASRLAWALALTAAVYYGIPLLDNWIAPPANGKPNPVGSKILKVVK